MRVFFRRSKRGVIRDNAAKGKAGERRVRDKYKKAGYKVERTGRGRQHASPGGRPGPNPRLANGV